MNKFPTIGILGGGQLAQMLALDGYPLGFRFVFFDPTKDACAGLVGELMVADYDNEIALEEFAKKCDFITYDFENVPVTAAEFVAKKTNIFPHPKVLEIAQDRLKEKLLSAVRSGIKTVIIPSENDRELSEVPKNIKDSFSNFKI